MHSDFILEGMAHELHYINSKRQQKLIKEEKMSIKKKNFEMPHVIVVLLMIMIGASL